MSNIRLIIEERAADIGNFMVGRLLPFRQKRMVGPFIFIDHMGPVRLNPGTNMDVPPHPHIGLSTLTYLFDGAIMHRDSIGSEVEIQPGAVNWMTAGKGVVHSERTPAHLRNTGALLHGLQIWVALPVEMEQAEPSFVHVDAGDIPRWHQDGVEMRLIAGEAFERKSAVPVYSPMYFIEIKSTEKTQLNIGEKLFGESALYILEGEIYSGGHRYEPKRILVAKDSTLCQFEMGENTTVCIFGGMPFEEERFIDWNFVNSDKSVIEKARKDWLNQSFKGVSGETDFVPLPQRP